MGKLTELGHSLGKFGDQWGLPKRTAEEQQERNARAEDRANKKEERDFLYTSGAIDALKAKAKELRGQKKKAKVRLAKPKAGRPMDAVLVSNYSGLFDELNWEAVVVGVQTDEQKERRLTVNGLETNAVGKQGLAPAIDHATDNPLHRSHFNIRTEPSQVGPHSSEILELGRYKLRVPRARKR